MADIHGLPREPNLENWRFPVDTNDGEHLRLTAEQLISIARIVGSHADDNGFRMLLREAVKAHLSGSSHHIGAFARAYALQILVNYSLGRER